MRQWKNSMATINLFGASGHSKVVMDILNANRVNVEVLYDDAPHSKEIHGRNNLSWTEKFKLDVWYVDNLSFKTDCSIVWTTLMRVIKKQDIDNSQSSQFTTELFNGTN